jgi:hypothetical protein
MMELAGLEPATSWVRYGIGAVLKPQGFDYVRSVSLSSVDR